MSETARIGIIGNGGFTSFLIDAWQELPGVEVKAIAARNQARLDATASKFGIPHVFAGSSGWQDLVAEAPVDIVAIVTPPHLHAEMAIAALKAGKAVLCEKPLATTVADAELIARAVRTYGGPLSLNYVMRFNPLFEAIKNVVEEGVLGNLHRVDFTNLASDEGLPPEHWFWDLEQSGGILVEHGVHFFDIYTWVLGEAPSCVQGFRTVRPGTTQEDRVLATVLYNSGALGTFYHAFDRPGRLEYQRAMLSFDQGVLEVEGWIAINVRVDVSVATEQADRLKWLLPPTSSVNDLPYEADQRYARGGGREYLFDRRLQYESRFAPDQGVMYRRNVQDSLRDLVDAWRNPGSVPRANVEAGLSSLKIACSV